MVYQRRLTIHGVPGLNTLDFMRYISYLSSSNWISLPVELALQPQHHVGPLPAFEGRKGAGTCPHGRAQSDFRAPLSVFLTATLPGSVGSTLLTAEHHSLSTTACRKRGRGRRAMNLLEGQCREVLPDRFRRGAVPILVNDGGQRDTTRGYVIAAIAYFNVLALHRYRHCYFTRYGRRHELGNEAVGSADSGCIWKLLSSSLFHDTERTSIGRDDRACA